MKNQSLVQSEILPSSGLSNEKFTGFGPPSAGRMGFKIFVCWISVNPGDVRPTQVNAII